MSTKGGGFQRGCIQKKVDERDVYREIWMKEGIYREGCGSNWGCIHIKVVERGRVYTGCIHIKVVGRGCVYRECIQMTMEERGDVYRERWMK